MRHAVTPFIILVENCMRPPVNISVFLKDLRQLQTSVMLNIFNSYIATIQSFDQVLYPKGEGGLGT